MRVLIVVPPDRRDWYDYLAGADGLDFSLLWYSRRGEDMVDRATLPVDFNETFYWRDYRSAAALLKAARPDKIVFFEIIDLNQIALNVAARHAGIRTFFIEHGAAGDVETSTARWKEISFWRHRLPYIVKRAGRALPDALASKFFYFSQARGFSSWQTYGQYARLPLQMMRRGPNEVLAQNIFRERVPDYMIVFNEVNFEYHRLYMGIDRSQAVLTGVPFHDRYYRDLPVEKSHGIFIDHPYLEMNLLGWTPEHHRKVAAALYEFAKSSGIKVYVKLHPCSNPAIWADYRFEAAHLEVLQFGEFTDLYLESRIVLGFSSSMIAGLLCARKNVVLVGWHPEPQIFGIDFSRYGLCHKSLEISDLQTQRKYWLSQNKALDNDKYQRFLRRFNYPFDGRAGERVYGAIQEL